MGSASRFDVKNSLTEKCENWTIRRPRLSLTMMTRFEHADMIASSASFKLKLQSGFSSGIPSPSTASKSNARTSASSCNLSGRTAATRHCNNRCACLWFGFFISLRMRSYVSSRPSGNSSRVRRTLDEKQCRRTSNWQTAHLNLCRVLRFGYGQMTTRLHSIRFLR
jgi:hypothetical protein